MTSAETAAPRRTVPTAEPLVGLVYAALLSQVVISAGTYVLTKFALAADGGLVWPELAWLRFTFSGLLYAAVLAAMRVPLWPPKALRRKIVLLGIIGLPINQGLFLSGMAQTSPTHGALLYALTPVFVVAGAWLFLGERISRRGLLGILSALLGATIVLLGKVVPNASRMTEPSLTGDLLVLGGVVAWAVYTTMTRPIAKEHGGMAATGWILMTGAILCVPAGPFVLREPAQMAAVAPTAWGALAYLVVLTSFVSYWLWGFGLRRLDATKVAVFSNLQPVATVAAEWFVFGSPITPAVAVGGTLVIIGVALTQK